MEGAMHLAGYFIAPNDLWNLIGTAQAPQIVDARRRDVYDASPGLLPTASWADARERRLDRLDRPGAPRRRGMQGRPRNEPDGGCRTAGARLRRAVLAGGYAAWSEARLPLVTKPALDRFAPKRPSLWVTRRRPKIDRIACPWLIRRFIDADARILFVDPPEVQAIAQGNRRDPVRHRRRRDLARGPALLVRHHAQAVRSGGRAVARPRSR